MRCLLFTNRVRDFFAASVYFIQLESKERKKKKIRRKEDVCSVNIYQLRNVRILSQNIMIDQSFDDNSQIFSRIHHLIIVEMFDVLSYFISVVHQRTKHDYMFDNLFISVTATSR
jgi:hypothetical protein